MPTALRKKAKPPPAPPSAADDARERILAAAETLFARKGMEKSSMRELTALAGVNVAAVNYYFRSKEGLAEELFDSVAQRVNQARLTELDAHLADAAAHHAPPALEAILSSFIRPYVETEAGPAGPLLAQLILQHRLAPSDMTVRVVTRHFDPCGLRYVEALAAAVPGVPTAEWFWRYTFMVSTVILTVTDQSAHNRLARLSGGAADTTRHDDLRRYLMAFLVGGLTAPTDQAPA
jgi:AcrR family transcriptional regulator